MSRSNVRLAIQTALALVLILAGFLHSAPTVYASRQTAAAVTLDPDGDDPRTELLYHWQDKRFSDEERRQIIGCAVLVSVIFVGSSISRRTRLRRQKQ